MASTGSIWAPFANEKYKQLQPNLKSPASIQALWQGLPMEHPIRANVWRYARESVALDTPPLARPSAKAQQNVVEKIRMELNSEGCLLGSVRKSVDDAAIEQILVQHAQKACLDEYMPGSVQLAALMLLEFDRDSNAALAMLIALTYRLHSYYCNSHVQLRRDCLVLAELIVADLPALADHLNSLAFDVVDLTDLICIWAAPVFIYSFPKPFVLRMLDLIFVLGPSVCLPVMYGFFKFFASDITVVHTLDSVFDFLNTVPGTLTNADLSKIFQAASEMSTQMDRLSRLRSGKDWIKTADHEGIPTFLPGLFLEKAATSAPATSMVRFLSSRFESQSTNDGSNPAPVLSRPRSGTVDYSQDGAERIQAREEDFAKLIAAESMIRTQNTKIERLEKQVLMLEAKALASSGHTTSVRAHSPDTAKSALVRELQSKQSYHNDPSEPPSVSSVAIHVDASGQDRFRSFSFSEMNEIYSRIHTLIDFPCVYMEGHLMKLSRAGLFGRQVLNQRWFILKGRYLTYYKSADHSKPQKDRCMNLKGCSVMAVDDHPKGDFSFVITCRSEQYILFASGAEDRTRWIAAIEASIRS